MSETHCPGQDQRYWKPGDIFYLNCPCCGQEIEFWKDEPLRICGGCKREINNPRLDLGCSKWCQYAKDCLGVATKPSVSPPLT
jgi:hypothetical protein